MFIARILSRRLMCFQWLVTCFHVHESTGPRALENNSRSSPFYLNIPLQSEIFSTFYWILIFLFTYFLTCFFYRTSVYSSFRNMYFYSQMIYVPSYNSTGIKKENLTISVKYQKNCIIRTILCGGSRRTNLLLSGHYIQPNYKWLHTNRHLPWTEIFNDKDYFP